MEGALKASREAAEAADIEALDGYDEDGNGEDCASSGGGMEGGEGGREGG